MYVLDLVSEGNTWWYYCNSFTYVHILQQHLNYVKYGSFYDGMSHSIRRDHVFDDNYNKIMSI